jgi:hypothetical protein
MKNPLLFFQRSLWVLVACLSYAHSARSQFTTAAAYPFSASSTTYNYLSGGTSVPGILGDDVTVTNIPLGFIFYFAGNNYTTVSVCSNGWLSFANTGSTLLSNDPFSNLSTIAPAVMPLWDDLHGSVGTPTYLTTGTAPNRVFTMEWRNWKWYYTAPSATISFQVKLYEDTRIEFLYKQEGSVTSSSATIGIAKSSSDWKVLNNTSSSPTPSSTTYVANITTAPANGQSYVWGQPPCLYTPVSGSATNITSSKATINWVHSSNGAPAQGYEIVVDQNAGNPAGAGTPVTGTSYTKTGLMPGTSYIAHVRGRCGSISTSAWAHIPFSTTNCISPQVSMANITHESASAIWSSLAPAINYQYILNTTGVPPVSDLGAGNTTGSHAKLTGLTPDTHYYLYMRTQCTNNETSDWEATEFTTMKECLSPGIRLTPVSPDVKAEWDDVPTAVAYEYALNSSATPLSLGKLIYETHVVFNVPSDDKPYYLHVRSKCLSIFTSSDWATVTVKEAPPTAITNVNGNNSLQMTAYPNPAKNVVTIGLSGLQSSMGTITLTDLTGKALLTSEVSAASLNLDMSSFPAGVYMIKYSNKEQHQVLKITKQ